MARRQTLTATAGQLGCCRVVSLVAVDERGQMVLPKKVREQARIAAGDQLALISWEQEGKIHGLFLVKADALTSMVSELLGPIVKGVAGR